MALQVSGCLLRNQIRCGHQFVPWPWRWARGTRVWIPPKAARSHRSSSGGGSISSSYSGQFLAIKMQSRQCLCSGLGHNPRFGCSQNSSPSSCSCCLLPAPPARWPLCPQGWWALKSHCHEALVDVSTPPSSQHQQVPNTDTTIPHPSLCIEALLG